MRVLATAQEMQEASRIWRRQGETVGLVPTMGFLHEGHLSLIRRCRKLTARTVVSIFVNPTQFGPTEDYETYPRDTGRDCDLCRREGVDVVYLPTTASMYADDHSTWVEESSVSKGLCGRSRPGHFRGVTTVVTKLFNAVLPDLAVFGQKDAQQTAVIRRMVRDLNFPVDIHVLPTVREADGLAMSSRNVHLSAADRRRALCIHGGLERARVLVKEGIRETDQINAAVRDALAAESVHVDYIEVVDPNSLKPLACLDRPALLAVAAWVGDVRLIDNCILQPEG